MNLQAAGRTDIGQSRSNNQDFLYVDDELGLFIVCDGVGGHMSGEVASRKATELVVEFIHENRSMLDQSLELEDCDDHLRAFVEQAIRHACIELNQMGRSNPQFSRMATTLTLLMIVSGRGVVGHVGDSRLYLKRNDEVTQLTTDHTVLGEYLAGNPQWAEQCTNSELVKRFRSMLTRAIGHECDVPIDMASFSPEDGDVLLLCSDGLSNYFQSKSQIASLLAGPRVTDVAENLVAYANRHGGNDNITAVVVSVANVEEFVIWPHCIDFDCDDTGEFIFQDLADCQNPATA